MVRVVELAGVGYDYAQPTSVLTVLDGVDLSVEPGQIVAIVGPSGSGKSTLLSIAGLLRAPMRGAVRLAGRETARGTEAERGRLRADHVGFLFQQPMLVRHWTVLENIGTRALAHGPGADPQDALGMLGRLGLAEHAHKRPGQLSGGQAQRVALCRALAGSPALLVADEPTGNLDIASADSVRETLIGVAGQGVGVLVATHDERTAGIADVVQRLDAGVLTRMENLA